VARTLVRTRVLPDSQSAGDDRTLSQRGADLAIVAVRVRSGAERFWSDSTPRKNASLRPYTLNDPLVVDAGAI